MPNRSVSDHLERLTVPLSWWLVGTTLVASLWLAVVVAAPDAVAWAVGGLALALLAGFFLAYGSVRIAVADGALRAGRARIEAEHLGAVHVLDAEQTRRTAGRDADARAHLVMRPYVRRAVRVDLVDPADPTPYWLISTRRPEQLAAAVRAMTAREV